MGRLLVDGREVCAVYYQLEGPREGQARPFGGVVSGETAALQRACREGEAVLVLRGGHSVRVLVTGVNPELGSAAVEVDAEMPDLF